MDPSSSSSKRKRDLDSLDEVSSCKKPKNDVFVNYSFEDIGKSFVSHVKGSLRRKGFTISDRTMLPIGQDEGFELLKAIQDSEIYVVVFSTNYAFSFKCLDELVLIMNCLPERKVFPIFFNVDPSHVRSQQQGSFMEAFLEHETNFDPERIQKWRQALKDAGQLSGITFQIGGDEAEFIEKIVEELEKMQSPQDLHVTDHPVGIGCRAEELISKLRLDCKDQVLVVGVFGISGIGKTTIVKATYNRIAAKFDVSCFLAVADIHDRCGRQNWKVKLQKMLISYLTKKFKYPVTYSHNDGVTKIRKLIRGRKILLVLDDIDKFQQLEELGINPEWFYNGSRIIVTTRDRQSLGCILYTSYHTTLLNRRESLTLFIRLMFAREDIVNTKFIEEVVSRAGGLPLVLKVWSRHFKQYKKEQWPSILETLKKIPHGDVQKQLQLSYDSFPKRSKKLFLDIVFFFHMAKKELVVKVLHDEDSGFFPDIEIQNLVDKSLVEIDYNKVSIHQAIREMGQEVVRQENEDEPGQRTRLMDFRDVVRVLRDCSGTKSVEGIRLDNMKEWVTVKVEAFKMMSNLRFIKVCDYEPRLQWSSSSSKDDMSSFCFKKLKYLEWEGFPYKCLDNIDMSNVVVIILCHSKLEKLWEGFKSLQKLRILDVSWSGSLTKTGNFVGLEKLEKLEKLSLCGCGNLEELDGSIGYLEKLVSLDLDHCTRLKSILNLPPNIEIITAVRCISLEKHPYNMSQLQFVKELWMEDSSHLEHEGFMKVIGLRNLQQLSMRNCNVSHVSSEIGNLVSLQYLNLSRNTFSSLPDNFSILSELVNLNMNNCSQLKSIPNLPPSIQYIKADACISLMNLPSNMAELQSLTKLYLNNCLKLGYEGFMKVTGLRKLQQLSMINCNVTHVSSEIGNLVSLQYLNLSRNTFSSLPDSFDNLSELVNLQMNDCCQLKSIPNLPPSIEYINADACISLMDLPSNMVELQSLTGLYLNDCLKLGYEGFMKVTGLRNLQKLSMINCNVTHVSNEIGNLVSLQYLNLSRNTFSSLPDSFDNLSELVNLQMNDCSQLKSISNLPPNIQYIKADACISLMSIPSNMVELQSLTGLYLDNCLKLGSEGFMKVTGLRNLQTLSMINCNVTHVSREIGDLVSLEYLDLSRNTFSSLPDNFSILSELVNLNMNDCSQLKSIPNLPPSIQYIKADACISLMNLPSNMVELHSLTELYLDDCLKLGYEGFMKVTGLSNLQTLSMINCNVTQVSREIGDLMSIEYLDISRNTFSSLPDSFMSRG